jgi:hypothetical protein
MSSALQPLQIPKRVARRPEEHFSHVVVHAHNFMPLPVEMLDRFRTNQSAAAGNKNFHPFESILPSVGCQSWKNRVIAANQIPELAEIGDKKTAPSLEDYQQSTGFLTAPRQD